MGRRKLKSSLKRKLREIGAILARNLFSFINVVIFSVVTLLIYFGDAQEGLFLGIVFGINIILGLVQDIHSWLVLEHLELLTLAHVLKINPDGSEISILPEEIIKGDKIRLKLGDQVPCDGTVISASNFEVNEGLITGESNSIARNNGETVLAGSIVTAGSAEIASSTDFAQSSLAKMTESIKRYSLNESPIQSSINRVIRYTGYLLVLVILFVIGRGLFIHEPAFLIVRSIGALSSMIVPQGLLLAMTLLFAYGGLHFYRRNVLLQEVNATEKLGRIQNLCMDKTGTITRNAQEVGEMFVPTAIDDSQARRLAAAYARKSADASQSMSEISKFLNSAPDANVSDYVPFSSWRRFGGVTISDSGRQVSVLAGGPEVFLPYLNDAETAWLKTIIETESEKAKTILCFAACEAPSVPRKLEANSMSLVAAFTLESRLREGTLETIKFFQARGVKLRIISGDHPKTVSAIAKVAGILKPEAAITGKELETWSEADYETKAPAYSIFARVRPEQKERIVAALKKDGFTAMIGDGANDALAIKKADLGIAMFDGAPATRQVASAVLVTNSFSELPGGVRLADSMIENMEIIGSVFLSQTFLGIFLFIFLSALGYSYPLSPLNITLINYFAVGIPGMLVSYWAIRPTEKTTRATSVSYLRRVMPVSISAALIQAGGTTAVFMASLQYFALKSPNTAVVLAFILFSFVFFIFTPSTFNGFTSRLQKFQFAGFGILAILLLSILFNVNFLMKFFNVVRPPTISLAAIAPSLVFFSVLLIIVLKVFFPNINREPAIPIPQDISSRSDKMNS